MRVRLLAIRRRCRLTVLRRLVGLEGLGCLRRVRLLAKPLILTRNAAVLRAICSRLLLLPLSTARRLERLPVSKGHHWEAAGNNIVLDDVAPI